MPPRVLLVEPDPVITDDVLQAARAIASVEHQAGFAEARPRLIDAAFEFLITNLRLGEFNGLHLVHLAAGLEQPPRCIVYTDTHNILLGQEVQRAGAFYEVASTLPVTLSAYISGNLPTADRRDLTRLDRRAQFRGGRRCWDEHVMHAGGA